MADLTAYREQLEATDMGLAPPPVIATREMMKKAELPLGWRDYCAHLLIPLNECRVQTMYWPFSCTHLRHAHEECEYKEYRRREQIQKRNQKEAMEAAKAGE